MATRLVSGNRMVAIEMQTWDGRQYTPDWSNDFFEVGNLKYNEDLDAYEVEDIDYCIDQANDWKDKKGDFYGEEDAEGVERSVDVDELDFPAMTRDGHYVREGDWISDSTGIFEVRDVAYDRIECREVIFEDDNSDDYHLSEDRVILKNREVNRMEYN